MPDEIDKQDALEQEFRSLVGIPPDMDGKQWFADVLNITMEQLEEGLTAIKNKLSELDGLENPARLYKVNVLLTELGAFLSKLNEDALKNTRIKEVLERVFAQWNILISCITLTLSPHTEEMREREGLEPVFSFCEQIVARYSAEYPPAWERAKEDEPYTNKDGTPRAASFLRPPVEFHAARNNESPEQALRCWADAYEGQIHKISSFIWYLAQERALVTSDAKKPKSKGRLFQEAIRLAEALELPFPFHRDLREIRNATNHNSYERISETDVLFLKEDRSEQFRLTTEEIFRCAEHDIHFSMMFDHALNLVTWEHVFRDLLRKGSPTAPTEVSLGSAHDE